MLVCFLLLLGVILCCGMLIDVLLFVMVIGDYVCENKFCVLGVFWVFGIVSVFVMEYRV